MPSNLCNTMPKKKQKNEQNNRQPFPKQVIPKASLREGGGYVIIRSATLIKKIVKTIE